MLSSPRSRRQFLRLSVVGSASAGLLAACGTAAAPAGPSEAGASAPTSPPSTSVAGQAGAASKTSTGSPSLAASGTSAPLAPPVTLNIGSNQSLAESGMYIAFDRGYFRDEGLNVNFQVGGPLETIFPLLTRGDLDAAQGGITPAIFNAVSRNVGVRIVTASVVNLPGRSLYFMARKELVDSGQLKAPRDLKGRTWSAPGGISIVRLEIENALKTAGLTFSDIKTVNLGYPEAVAALANKGIDLAFMIEPLAAQSVEKGIAVRYIDAGAQALHYPASIYVYGTKMLQQPEVGRRFMLALLRGVRDYENAASKNQGRQEAIASMIKHTSVKDASLYDKIVWQWEPTNGEIFPDKVQELVDYFKANNQFEQPPDLSKVLDQQFTQYALQQLGPYQS